MFPQPSPNSQAIFNAIQSGGATPGTLDFHRTAMHARANQGNNFAMPQPTSQPQDPNIQPNLDSKGFGQQQRENDPFEQHDANDAANGLFLLAQARSNRGQPQAYPPPQQQPQMNYMGNNSHLSNQMGQQSHENSPHLANRAANKNSIGSNMSGSTQNDQGDFSESGNSEDTKPAMRNRSKKGSNTKAPANGRRKMEDTPAKSNKRQKTSSLGMGDMPDDEMESDEDDDKPGPDGKKMTDEEKRKNFLERNRYATTTT